MFTIIEFCCSKQHKCFHLRYTVPGARVVKVMVSDGPITSEGLERALSYVNEPMSDLVIVMSSVQCTLSCAWHRVTQKRSKNSPTAEQRFQDKMKVHEELFTSLWIAFGKICGAVPEVGGNIVQGWCAGSHVLNRSEVQKPIQQLGVKRTYFDGCSFGLRSVSGKLIRKPWVMYITVPRIVKEFNKQLCDCTPRSHEQYKGSMAERSAFYTWNMTDILHTCFRARVCVCVCVCLAHA